MKITNKTEQAIRAFIGFESNKTGHLEKWVSASGGLLGIYLIMLISQQFLDLQASSWVVASMGASAVLVFAVPHGLLSQPWAVLGGHFISAIVGVSCASLIPDLLLAAAVAVGLAIGCMHYLRCIHPPGGATALTAVVGGADIHALGYQFVFTPVLINAASIVFIAFVFNFGFRWRRYPATLAMSHTVAEASNQDQIDDPTRPDETDLQAALQAMNSTIDISSQDLLQIYELARQNKLTGRLNTSELKLGHYYSNGLFGADWQVRQIIDMAVAKNSPDDLLIYKVVAGSGRRTTGSCSFEAFARWSCYEVFLNENSWQREKLIK